MLSFSYYGGGGQKNMVRMTKRIIIIFSSVIVVLLGFFRDYLFGNINWVFKTLTTQRRLQARKEFHFLLEWSPNEILWLKWILTIVFYFLFFGFTYLILRYAFNNRVYNRITIGVFLFLFVVSGIMYTIGYISNTSETLYGSIRTLMGMAQSFIPLMILGVLYKFIPDSQDD